MPPTAPLDDRTRARLDARLAREQRESRLPSVVAGVVRGGELDWVGACGTVDGAAPTADTQYRIGSITKPMVAVLVMRLRDEGLVELSAPVDRYAPGAPAGITVGETLSHAAGLTSETTGAWWERVPGGDWDELTRTLTPDALRHERGGRFHYSNVGFGILGEVVARLRGAPWHEVLHDELLAPLGMTRSTTRPVPPAAQGYAVHPHADLLLAQPEHDAGAMAPAGQLWCSLTDLARFAAFLAGDTRDVLSRDTLAEMLRPRVVHDIDGEPWTGAMGLGVQLWNVDGRRAVGHGGSMPGFIALVRVDVATGMGTVLQTNTTAGLSRSILAELEEIALDGALPEPDAPWAPSAADPELLELTGPWYWGPRPYTLTVHGADELSLDPVEAGRASRFRRDASGTWVGLDDYYAGERLVPVRDEAGRLTHLDLASFVFTRSPYDPAEVLPGGRDERGWHAP